LPSPATATPIVQSGFEQLFNISQNSLGFTTGSRIRYGATVTSAAGSTNLAVIQNVTTGFANTTNTVTGLPLASPRSLTYSGSPVIGGLFTGTIPYNPSLTGPWTLTFSDGVGGPAVVTTPAIPSGVQPLGFVQSITLSGTGNNPTFTWAAPLNTNVNGYRINLYDAAQVSPTSPFGQILSSNFAPTVNSFTVTNGTPGLQPGYNFNTTSQYSIEVSALQTRNGSTTNLGNPNVAALSRVYADFKITNTGNIQVNLPVARVNGADMFDLTVQPGVRYFIAPDMAPGYKYAAGTGNPNFASVFLPSLQASPYELSYTIGNSSFNFQSVGGQEFFFPTGGVNAFSVQGVDPSSAQTFLTGLTFVGGGQFTGTVAPIVTAVPEPASAGLFLAGVLGVWCARRGKVPRQSLLRLMHPSALRQGRGPARAE